MWIRVAKDKTALKIGSEGHIYIDGEQMEEFFFNEDTAFALDADNFLEEMWRNFDAMFDWGDCDFFDSDKCEALSRWLQKRLLKDVPEAAKQVYETMLKYTNIAVKNKTGIYFDF